MANKNEIKELLSELKSYMETANDQVGCLKKLSKIDDKVKIFLNNQNDNLEYKNFFSSSLGLFCVANIDGSFERINPTFSKVLGFSEEHILATPFADFIHPDDLESTVAKVRELIAGFPSVGFENRYRKSDGTYLSLIWSCTINAETGKLYAVARDLTVQKKVEVELSKQHSLLNALMESIPDLIFYKDLDGVYVDCNNAFEKFINKDKLDIRCKDCVREQNKLRRKLKRYAPPKPKMCACCGKSVPDKMVLDHCHITLKFRGWLCINCNMGLGKLGDNIEGLMKAVRYLENVRRTNERNEGNCLTLDDN